MKLAWPQSSTTEPQYSKSVLISQTFNTKCTIKEGFCRGSQVHHHSLLVMIYQGFCFSYFCAIQYTKNSLSLKCTYTCIHMNTHTVRTCVHMYIPILYFDLAVVGKIELTNTSH